jgi:phosphoribosylformylglycinamidine cyclo-ligase
LGARLYTGSWEEPTVFGLIRSLGGVAEEEMRRVFNLGVGFCAVVPEDEAERALVMLGEVGCGARCIGEVVVGEGVEFV